ncbi:protein of unknown function [Paraburkholderia dioscoreae]|uniref:Uncharacterized protein n=1 Tax=Paraburkholderia dioscoreae TaxID=2604047 RepID=A0A5Q4ZGG6_9BURK|nr:protein of unknown function [Paraburkholderia dioscoreae]
MCDCAAPSPNKPRTHRSWYLALFIFCKYTVILSFLFSQLNDFVCNAPTARNKCSKSLN